MKIDPAAREYVHWPVTNPDDVTLEASVDRETWIEATAEEGGVRLLLTGPDVTDATEEPELVLARGRNVVTFRAVDDPEIVIRGGGVITVT